MISTLDRYIAVSFYRGFFLVALVLITLFSFAALVQELDDVGKGSYELGDAVLYVLLTMPRRFYDLAPVSALLGALFSLGSLAAESELVAMRSIGAGVGRIVISSMKATLPVLALMFLVVQILGPKYETQARSLRSAALTAGPSLKTSEGFWLKDGSQFVRIGTLLDGKKPADLLVIQLDQDGRLHRYIKATSAEHDGQNWVLHNASVTTYNDIGSVHEAVADMPWTSGLGMTELSKVPLAPESLPPTELVDELRRRRELGLPTDSHALALWYMLTRPFSFLVMVLFAVPFVFSSLRDSSQGRRTVIGAVIGILAYLLDQISGFAGLIFQVHPAVTSLGPPLIIGTTALILLSRVGRPH